VSAEAECSLCEERELCVGFPNEIGRPHAWICFECTARLNAAWAKEAVSTEAEGVMSKLSPAARSGLDFVGRLLQKKGKVKR
jgi:hypothetical protein